MTNVRPVVLATLPLGTRSDGAGATHRPADLTERARREPAVGVVHVQFDSHRSSGDVDRLRDPRHRAGERLSRIRGNRETSTTCRSSRPRCTPREPGSTSRSRLLSTIRTIGVAAPGPPVGPTSAPGCTLRSVTTPLNGAVIRRYAFHVADRLERLPRGFDVLLRRRDLTLVGFDRLLRQHHIVAGDDTRRGGRRFQLVVRARVGLGLRSDGRELRLRALQLRLRLGPSARPARAPRARRAARPRGRANRDRRESSSRSRSLAIERDGLVGRQFARQRQRHVERLFDDLDHFDRRRSSRRGLLGGLGRRVAAAARPAPATRARPNVRALGARCLGILIPLPARDTHSRDRRDPSTGTRPAPTAARASTPTAARSSVATVAAARPPMTARPSGAVASAPSPNASAIGIMPAIIAALVISTGRMRDARGVDGRLQRRRRRARAPARQMSPAGWRSPPRRRSP